MTSKMQKSTDAIRRANASKTVAEKTADAYSVGRYANWRAVCLLLLNRGYSEQEVEAIVRSKWTRWAADASDARDGQATAQDVARFLDKRGGMFKSDADLARQVAEIVAEGL